MQDIVGASLSETVRSMQLVHIALHTMSNTQISTTTQELSWHSEADTHIMHWCHTHTPHTDPAHHVLSRRDGWMAKITLRWHALSIYTSCCSHFYCSRSPLWQSSSEVSGASCCHCWHSILHCLTSVCDHLRSQSLLCQCCSLEVALPLTQGTTFLSKYPS